MSNDSNPIPRFASPEGNQVVPAGFWARFAAVVIDGLVVTVISLPITLGLGMLQNKTNPSIPFMLFTNLLSMVISGCYFGYFYSKKGASPGKSVMGLRLVDYQTGTNVSFTTGFLRETVGKIVSFLSLGIGFLMAAIRKDKRALHDLITDTQVVRIK
ncbi:MAG: RDD family protein [Proteobacteria bacterium]|nr:MAG: RDD family protein [Pseudomonadota bacterium]